MDSIIWSALSDFHLKSNLLCNLNGHLLENRSGLNGPLNYGRSLQAGEQKLDSHFAAFTHSPQLLRLSIEHRLSLASNGDGASDQKVFLRPKKTFDWPNGANCKNLRSLNSPNTGASITLIEWFLGDSSLIANE